MSSAVYRILNKTKGKSYIGASMSVKYRIDDHVCKLRNNKHHCKELQADYNGGHDIVFELLEEVGEIDFSKGICFQHELLKAEQKHMDLIKNKYNTYSAPNTHNIREDYRMEPLNEIGTNEWIQEMRGYIDRIRPVKNEEGSNE